MNYVFEKKKCGSQETDTADVHEVSIYVTENTLIVNLEELTNSNVVFVKIDKDTQEQKSVATLELNDQLKEDLTQKETSKANQILEAQKKIKSFERVDPTSHLFFFFVDNVQHLKSVNTSNKSAFQLESVQIKL